MTALRPPVSSDGTKLVEPSTPSDMPAELMKLSQSDVVVSWVKPLGRAS
jgi:hypothetical protein